MVSLLEIELKIRQVGFRKAKLRQPTGQRQSNVRTQQKNSIGPILFLYYEESLVSRLSQIVIYEVKKVQLYEVACRCAQPKKWVNP